jgi:hypothetical protein
MNQLKLLIVSSALVTLTGCSTLTNLYESYFMAGYDNVEYAITNKVRTFAELSVEDCNDYEKSKANFNRIYSYSLELKNFTQYIPDNKESAKLGKNIEELTKQAKDHYAKNTNVSETFCKLKLQQISRSAEMAQKVIGAKPR